MGWNTVAIILNDAVSYIEKDPEFGARIGKAIRHHDFDRRSGNRPTDIPARLPGGGGHGNAAAIVSQAHADYWQVVVVGHNTGYHLGDDDVPDEVLERVAEKLRYRGYRVTKPKPKAV